MTQGYSSKKKSQAYRGPQVAKPQCRTVEYGGAQCCLPARHKGAHVWWEFHVWTDYRETGGSGSSGGDSMYGDLAGYRAWAVADYAPGAEDRHRV